MLHNEKSRSVLMEIARFMVAYIFLLIGFMMSFMVCFADQDAFQNFPGMFIKVRSNRIICPGKEMISKSNGRSPCNTTPEQKIGIIFIRSPP